MSRGGDEAECLNRYLLSVFLITMAKSLPKDIPSLAPPATHVVLSVRPFNANIRVYLA